MSVEINENTKQISYDAYVKKGGMQCLRSALNADDPDQLYNYLKNNGIEKPELYGVFHPIVGDVSEIENMTKDELIVEVINLKTEYHKLKRNISIYM